MLVPVTVWVDERHAKMAVDEITSALEYEGIDFERLEIGDPD